MNKLVLAIFDTKAQVFGQVITAPNVPTVTRELQDMLREGNNTVAKHPEDFALYEVGSFDDETGQLGYKTPELLYKLSSLLAVDD